MGFGDEIIGSGVARGAAARGKRIAFGDGKRIIWSAQAQAIYRDNPNVARPGSERDGDLEWVRHFAGERLYGRLDGGAWRFTGFQVSAGEVFFGEDEYRFARATARGIGKRFAIIEPHIKETSVGSGNKSWGFERYKRVARLLKAAGIAVVQFDYGKPILDTALPLKTPSFRHALAALASASLYIGPEGGLHHGAAAVGTKAVVIFGGFNHPRNFGYAEHANLHAGGEPCGRQKPCGHCRDAMASIPVEHVYQASMELTA